jgi:hypothetical protein
MKYLTVCAASLLAFGLAALVTPTFAADDGARRQRAGQSDCTKCPKLRPHYDSTEVVKDSKVVDHSRVIEAQSVVPSKRLIETNHLIIHESEVRHVGTVEHNHTIIEKELVLTKKNIDHRYVTNNVNLVEHKYNTRRLHVLEEREIPGKVRHIRCNCHRPPLVRAYGMAKLIHAYGIAPKYVGPNY